MKYGYYYIVKVSKKGSYGFESVSTKEFQTKSEAITSFNSSVFRHTGCVVAGNETCANASFTCNGHLVELFAIDLTHKYITDCVNRFFDIEEVKQVKGNPAAAKEKIKAVVVRMLNDYITANTIDDE